MDSVIQILNIVWWIIAHGGWAVFVVLAIVILYKLYMNEIQENYKQTIEWVFLEIKAPKENLTSYANAEQIFHQLHMLFDNWSPQEKYLEGRVMFWLSLEIVSLGGTISFVLRVPKKQRQLVEASFYANYPHIEINEIEDYLAHFDYDPDDNKYDLFGSEFTLTAPQSIPIRTYKEFISLKGPDASEKVLDPLIPLLEVFTRLDQNEFYALQIIIRPVADGALNSEGKELVEKLSAEKDFQQLDDITKLQITGIKTKIGKPCFDTKIRVLHMGSKDVFNSDAKKMLLSPMKIFSSTNLNGFRPTFSPKLQYRISASLEAPYINYWVRQRKIDIFKAFKARTMWIGDPSFILNSEELATLFHFPVTSDIVNPSVESVEAKKIQPPSNLPI